MQKSVLFKTVGLTLGALVVSACANKAEIEQPVAAPEPVAVAIPVETVTLSAEELQAQAQAELRKTTVFYFDFDIAEFKNEDRDTLTFHARDLAANPGKRVRLEGHADERGTREYNLALGERRANGILNYLIVNGASRSQIEVVSYGEERSAQSGQTESAYSRNRRVEIVAR